jgi:uncharacterized membrane protein
MSLLLFLRKGRICSGAILAAILAAILDLEVTCIFKIIFDGFIGLGMVKNVSIDTKSMTICNIHGVMSILMYLPISVFGHLGGHFIRHIGITGDQYLCK